MDILKLDPQSEAHALVAVVDMLKKGGTVVIPTDTVYGLAADAMNPKAIEKIFKIKGRAESKPMGVFVLDFVMMDIVALVSSEKRELISKFDTVTAVLPARGWMPLNLRASGLTIGVRIPQDHFVQKILHSFGRPLAQTSANVSGAPSRTQIEDVLADFKSMPIKPDLIIDGGDLGERSPSMVVDFTKDPPQVLRTGPMSREALLAMLGENES